MVGCSRVHISKHSPFRLKITVGCLTSTYPTIHFSLFNINSEKSPPGEITDISFYFNSKTIELQRVNTVIIFRKMVFRNFQLSVPLERGIHLQTRTSDCGI